MSVSDAETGVVRLLLCKSSLRQIIAWHEETRPSNWWLPSSLSRIAIQSPLGSVEFSWSAQ